MKLRSGQAKSGRTHARAHGRSHTQTPYKKTAILRSSHAGQIKLNKKLSSCLTDIIIKTTNTKTISDQKQY